MLEGIFWHLFYGREGCIKIERIGKTKTSFGDILVANNASKWVQTIKKIMMYLLQTCRCTNRNFIYIARLKEMACII